MMKKRIILLCIAVFLFFFSAQTSFAQSSDDWIITNFQSSIQPQNNGSILVTETIGVDFLISKHGIFRDIPYIYTGSDGTKTYTKVSVVAVKNDDVAEQYDVYTNGYFKEIKIGDPHYTMTGHHIYTITYTVLGVLRSYSDHDELYWNVTGNSWGVPIQNAYATVDFPQNSILKTTCYQGPNGNTQTCNNTNQTTFTTTSPLQPGEGLTIVVGYKKGLFPLVTVPKEKTFFDILTEPLTLILAAAFSVIGIICIFLLWTRKGRDLWYKNTPMLQSTAKASVKPIGGHDTIVVEYTPPDNLRPAEIGIIIDEKADTVDVTSTIIDLATRGYLTITEQPKKWIFGSTDYLLKRTEKDYKDLNQYEILLLNNIFDDGNEIELSALKRNFYQQLSEVKKALYQDVVQKKYFSQSPETTRALYFGFGIGIIIAGAALIYIAAIIFIGAVASFGIGTIVTGLFMLIFANKMSRRSALGHEMYRRIKGYKLFIENVEKYRQQFFEKENMFNEVLPYAIMFGLTKKFEKAMQDMGVKPPQPTWYYGAAAFNVHNFSSNLTDFSSSFSTAIASTPSGSGGFGGGGGSGGGFGGGGGGSW